MLINEMFYSIQGEGASVGVPSVFIRLQGCNLSCPWCDSKYAVNASSTAKQMTPLQVYEDTMALLEPDLARNVVITGGEPLLQKDEVLQLASSFIESGVFVEIETNGTIGADIPIPSKLMAIQWNVSPKQGHINPEVLNQFAHMAQAYFKFVINPEVSSGMKALEFIKAFKAQYESNEDLGIADRILLMPECQTQDEYMDRATPVFRQAKLLGVRFSTRVQVFTSYK